MEEVIQSVCGNCEGSCCNHYPHFIEDVDGEIVTCIQEWDGPDLTLCLRMDRLTPLDQARWKASSMGCYYYERGGCTDEERPPWCYAWTCGLITELIWNGDISVSLVPTQPGRWFYNLLQAYRESPHG